MTELSYDAEPKEGQSIFDRIFQELERLSMNHEILRKKLSPLIIEVPDKANVDRLDEISRNRLHEVAIMLRAANQRLLDLTSQIEV